MTPRGGNPRHASPLLLRFLYSLKNTTNDADRPGVGFPSEASGTRKKRSFFRVPYGVVGRTTKLPVCCHYWWCFFLHITLFQILYEFIKYTFNIPRPGISLRMHLYSLYWQSFMDHSFYTTIIEIDMGNI